MTQVPDPSHPFTHLMAYPAQAMDYCCMGSWVYSFTQGLWITFSWTGSMDSYYREETGIVCISHPAVYRIVIVVSHGQLFWVWLMVFLNWSWELNRNFGVPDPVNDPLFGTEMLDNTISTFSTVQPKNNAPSLLTSIYLLIPIYLIC